MPSVQTFLAAEAVVRQLVDVQLVDVQGPWEMYGLEHWMVLASEVQMFLDLCQNNTIQLTVLTYCIQN